MDYGIQPQAGLREVETFRLPADADGGCWKEPGVFTAGLVGAMFLAPAIAFAESGPVSPPGLFRHLQYICSGIDNSYNCAKAVEADRFRKGIAGVSRNGRDLVIKVGASQATVFQDVGRGESTRGARYSYVDYFPSIRSHVVYVQYYEGGRLLIGRQGFRQEGARLVNSDSFSRFFTIHDGDGRHRIWVQWTSGLAHDTRRSRTRVVPRGNGMGTWGGSVARRVNDRRLHGWPCR